jgi:hypothetical protein
MLASPFIVADTISDLVTQQGGPELRACALQEMVAR